MNTQGNIPKIVKHTPNNKMDYVKFKGIVKIDITREQFDDLSDYTIGRAIEIKEESNLSIYIVDSLLNVYLSKNLSEVSDEDLKVAKENRAYLSKKMGINIPNTFFELRRRGVIK